MPKLRGRGVSPLKSIQKNASAVNLKTISELYKAGEVVNVTTLVEKGAIRAKKREATRVKILGTGELDKKVIFEGVEISNAAKAKVEAAGAEVR
jgi:large subunit ribosomal protein L15